MVATDSNVTNIDGTFTLTSTYTLNGTVATATTTALTGTDTLFDMEIKVGDTINVSGETARIVDAVTDNTNATVSVAFAGTNTGLSATVDKSIPAWLSADIDIGRDFGAVQALGSDRTENTSGNKRVTATLTKVFGLDTDDIMTIFQKGSSCTFSYVVGNGGTVTLSGGKITGVPIANLEGSSAEAVQTAIPVVFTDFAYTS